MRHRKAIRKIGKPTAHRKALLRNLVTSFFQNEKVITTKARAKAAQQVAERLIRYSISGTLEDKRRIISYLKNRETAHKLIKLGAEKFANAPRGGRTAVYKLGYRKGDGAEMAVLSLLLESTKKKEKKKRRAKKEKVIEAVPESEVKTEEEPPAEETEAKANIEEEALEESAESQENISSEAEETEITESEQEIEESALESDDKSTQSAEKEETPDSEDKTGDISKPDEAKE